MNRFYVITRSGYPQATEKYYNRDTRKFVGCVLPECLYFTHCMALDDSKHIANTRVRTVEFTIR